MRSRRASVAANSMQACCGSQLWASCRPMIRACVALSRRSSGSWLSDGFVLRYRSETDVDGLAPGEGAFLPCTFWLADAYILQGRNGEARALFERLMAVRNDVGLLAEEYVPHARRQVGNFP